jgi:hypothetical protein
MIHAAFSAFLSPLNGINVLFANNKVNSKKVKQNLNLKIPATVVILHMKIINAVE